MQFTTISQIYLIEFKRWCFILIEPDSIAGCFTQFVTSGWCHKGNSQSWNTQQR